MAKKKTETSEAIESVAPTVGIRERNIVSEMRESYINYSMSVIVARALPDVRDGLKPVQRRIIYVMEKLGIRYNTKHKKSAQTVGEVLGKYHPHGDVAVYDALVRMAQDFSMRYPLVDGQGNFGCFTKDTKVQLTDGRTLSFEELITEHAQGKKNWTYTYNTKDKVIEIAEIENPRLTRKNAELIEVTLDNGQKIRCTPNHKFMLRDGSYCEAQNLKPATSLMPVCIKPMHEYKRIALKSKILAFASKVIYRSGKLTPELYEKFRTTNGVPKFENALTHFGSFKNLYVEAKNYNHKVVSIKQLETREDVFDLTISSWHNFALAGNIFVHNSIDGDSAASMRYTEARLSKVADELTKDLEKETVTFRDNYDGTTQEPVVLPSVIPNLLLNGAEGIAVGMATKIPPHNLGEIVDALSYMIEKHISEIDPKTLVTTELVVAGFSSTATTEELMKFVKGPDFPTGAVMYDKKEIQNIYALGKGKALMRAVAKIEETKNGRFQIIVNELPYQVNKARLIAKIADLVKTGKIDGISDLRDESARGDIRVIIEIKREGNPNTILNSLFKYTEMQLTFNANILALVEGEPQVLTLKNILELFITHRQAVVIRRTEYDLRIAKARAHILEGLLIALDHLDEVIRTIRESEDQDTAKTNLITRFDLSDLQATAILDMQLRRLAALERKKIQDEYKEIMKKIKDWEALLRNPIRILETIDTELKALKEAYPSPRRTKVIAGKPGEFSEEDLVKPENVIITLSQNGYVKRMPIDTYRTQNRGGKGVIGMTTKETDAVAHVIMANTHDDILFFTNKGKVYQVKVYDIPEFSRTAKGQAIINIISVESGELVTSILTKSKEGFLEDEQEIQEGEEVTERHGQDYQYLVMATKNGTVKKTKISEYEGIRKSGVIGIKLEKDDELVWVKPSTGKSDLLLVTNNAQSIKFNEKDIRETGRASMGVRGIKVKGAGNEVVGMDIVRKDEGFVLVILENGFGKMTRLSEYAIQGRGGQGILTARVTDKTGNVVTMRIMDHPDKELLILSKKGQAIRLPVKDIPVLGRQTSGVKLIKLDSDDKVAEVACI